MVRNQPHRKGQTRDNQNYTGQNYNRKTNRNTKQTGHSYTKKCKKISKKTQRESQIQVSSRMKELFTAVSLQVMSGNYR